MPRNKFPRRSLVKLLMCDDPECNCDSKFVVGEEGHVTNALGRYIIVKLQPYEGLMERVVRFNKPTAEKHLERLDKRVRSLV